MGARFVKPKRDYHTVRLRGDSNNGEILLIGTGRKAYLWAGVDGNYEPLTFSGQQTLRKFAKAILRAIPERKRK